MSRPLRIKVSILNLAVLLYNIHKGAAHDKVGFVDADNTLNSLTRSLEGQISVPTTDLESALWSCNLMCENEEFWHPRDETFNQFVKSVLKGLRFDKKYNIIE